MFTFKGTEQSVNYYGPRAFAYHDSMALTRIRDSFKLDLKVCRSVTNFLNVN